LSLLPRRPGKKKRAWFVLGGWSKRFLSWGGGGGGGMEPFISLSEIEGRLHSCASPNLADLMTELPRVLLETFIHLQHAALNYKTSLEIVYSQTQLCHMGVFNG